MTDPKRRWARFSLRTMFVAVAILCLWFAWNANLVRQRKAWLNRVGPARGQLIDSTLDGPNMARLRILNNLSKPNAQPPIASSDISFVRQLMGDGPVDFLAVPASQAARVRSLFPEAHVLTVPDDDWNY